MQTRTWKFIDKSTWARGPWDAEPDKLQWTDPATGLPCMVRRTPDLGQWCGYVGVPPGHPVHGQNWSGEVHGGVTFVGGCSGGASPGDLPRP